MLWTNIFILGYLTWYLWHLHRQHGAFALRATVRESGSRYENLFSILGSLLFCLLIWNLLAQGTGGISGRIPSPLATAIAFWRLVGDGTLIREASISALRIAFGFIGASIIGVSLGILGSTVVVFYRITTPINSFLRYIPPTAFISLLIVYLGIGETYKYAVVFFGVVFFITQMVIDVVDDVDRRFLEMAWTSGFPKHQLFFLVIIPATAPQILDVLRINLSAAWTFLVAAEIIGAQEGLGFLVARSQRFLRIDNLYVAIISFGLIGIVTDRALQALSRKLFKWHYLKAAG